MSIPPSGKGETVEGHRFDKHTTLWYFEQEIIESPKGIFSRNRDLVEGIGKIDKQLNLKGKVCPYTFIESMLSLEEMKAGEILRIIVDFLPAVSDVPTSLKNEGYEILDVTPLNGTDWAIIVKNKQID